jgi:hypothetical protein
MRRIFSALVLCLALALPAAAHADPFKYTIVNSIPDGNPNDNYDFSTFNGTYTFTVPYEITVPTIVYGPLFSDPQNYPYPYIYVADFTTPSGSPVRSIELDPLRIKPFYNVQWFSANGGGTEAVGFSPDPKNPNKFGSTSWGYIEFTDLGSAATAPTPEPSTIALLGTGLLGIAVRIRRRV